MLQNGKSTKIDLSDKYETTHRKDEDMLICSQAQEWTFSNNLQNERKMICIPKTAERN